jgi:hypothetical protein
VSVLEAMESIEREFLRAVYELAERTAKRAVAFADAQIQSGHSEQEADQACDFWADRGILEFTSLGHVALTHLGLRRAERLAQRGWQPRIPF